ncbi:MAG TPA: GldG family protein [bacterium]|nr:GldG family protein [bacterium]
MINKTNLFLVIGIILALVGLFVWAIRSVLDPWSIAPLALGVILILIYVLMNFSTLVGKLSGRSAKAGFNSAVMVIITLAIICFLQVLLTRHSARFDTTRSGKYTLADQTVQVLKNLKQPVTITYLWNPELFGDRQKAEDLFKEFRHYSDKIEYRFVDPVKDPVEVERFAIGDTVTLNSSFVECGTKREKVTGVDEGAFTNALIKVTREQTKKVYFLTKHGEKASDDTTTRGGIGFLKRALEQEAYEMADLELTGLTEVPTDCALLVIAGPQTSLFENEVAAIKDYLRYGGSLLLFQDPRRESGLETLLRDSYGVWIQDDIILDNDPLSAVFGQTQLVLTIGAASYGSHEATKGVERVMTVYSQVRSLQKDPNPPEGVRITELVKSSNDSFGETEVDRLFNEKTAANDPAKDHQGPLTMAVAVDWDAEARISDATQEESAKEPDVSSAKKPQGRMIVFGDSDCASNQFFQTNKDFLLNCVNWLSQEEDLISIRPKEEMGQPIFMSAVQQRIIFWVPVVILPLLVLLVGVMVYMTRRARG